MVESHPLLPQLDCLPRFPLLDGLTPIQRLLRLERALGGAECPQIYVKRDDLMGVGGGGNKLRKLELLLGEAIADGCDTFVTTGGRQSNHARLSAAAAARAGLACELVLTDVVPRDDDTYRHNGNVLLDGIFGATIHHRHGQVDALAVARERAASLAAAGRKAYVVGAGGSSPRGCLGYAACAAEVVAQEQELGFRFHRIIVPNGSSGTHAGLLAGMAAIGDEPARLQSFTVLASIAEAEEKTRVLARETLTLLGSHKAIADNAVAVAGDQLGEGYGIPTSAMLRAVRLLARTEGLLLDPVYGGKAFAGLLAAIHAGRFRRVDAVLFVMTGGTPGLFAYASAFQAE